HEKDSSLQYTEFIPQTKNPVWHSVSRLSLRDNRGQETERREPGLGLSSLSGESLTYVFLLQRLNPDRL
ncbi:MAG TPA: hypothetical protein VMM56_07855, partial [Planctomycetaceae bacterium]|nr:hypothetical protein [Planctomycetaceae bacterium]